MVITGITQDSQFLPKGNSKKLKMAAHFSGSGPQTPFFCPEQPLAFNNHGIKV